MSPEIPISPEGIPRLDGEQIQEKPKQSLENEKMRFQGGVLGRGKTGEVEGISVKTE